MEKATKCMTDTNTMNSLSRHDPLTSHLVKGVLTFESSGVCRVLGDTDTETELVVGHVADVGVSKNWGEGAVQQWARNTDMAT